MQDFVKPLQLNSTELAVSRRSRESSRSIVPQHSFFQKLLQRFPLKRYAQRLPLLTIGILCYIATGCVFLTVEPRSIQHILLTNSYSPIVLLLGTGHFCSFSYLFLNSRRGAVISLVLSAILFLRLQQVLTPQLVAQVIIAGVGLEVAYLLLCVIFQFLHPQLRKLGHRIPKQTPASHAFTETSYEELPTEQSEQPAHSKRTRGRKRKHHFFGK